MKTIAKLLMAIIMIALPAVAMAQAAEKVPFTLAKNYFLKNDAQLAQKKITSQKDFDRYFGAAAVMGKDGMPTKIDFTKQFVIAIAGQPTNHHTTYEVTGITVEDGMLDVAYTATIGKEAMSYYMKPLVLVVLDINYARMSVTYSGTIYDETK